MRKAGDIILDLFKDRFGPGFMENARSTAGLFSSWEKVAAQVWPQPFDADQSKAEADIPAVAVHSRIRELERGVLLVEADHPGWIQILQTKQAELLAVVQRRYPDLGILGIAFRLSREPAASPGAVSTPDERLHQPEQAERKYSYKYEEAVPANSRNVSRDEEFYRAMKGLEESINERNRL